jgi:hypothetical protein
MQNLVLGLFQYLISPTIVVLIMGKIYGLGELNQKIKTALLDIAELKKDVRELKSNMTVVKTYLGLENSRQ